jgi:hypothetical protein
MKVITIAQVQFLAEKQILQQRQCLRDIAAVPLQTCNDLLLPANPTIALGCMPNRLLNSRSD